MRPFQQAFGPIEKWIGREWLKVRRRLLKDTKFIGVTGTAGKSTTVALVEHILKCSGLSVEACLRRNDAHDIRRFMRTVRRNNDACVLEISGHTPDAIPSTMPFVKPDIGIVTAVGSEHWKTFRSREAIAEAKTPLVAGLSSSGTAILNRDDPLVFAMAGRTRARVLTFGHSADADLRIRRSECRWPEPLHLHLQHDGQTFEVRTQIFGRQFEVAVAAALACAVAMGVELAAAAASVASFLPIKGRNSVHRIPNAPIFIDDTKKAPLWSIDHCLNLVRDAQAPRRTIVIGTLSDYSGSASNKYRRIAAEAAGLADRVIFVGNHAASAVKRAAPEHAARLFAFYALKPAAELIVKTAIADELIVLKASKSDRLGDLIDEVSTLFSRNESSPPTEGKMS